jgi:hypothetical protein
MILKISNNIVEAVTGDGLVDVISFLEDLVHYRSIGSISIDCKKTTCIELIETGQFSIKVVALLNHEKQASTFNKSVIDFFSHRLNIFHSDFTSSPSVYDESNIPFDLKGYSAGRLQDNLISMLSIPFLNVEDRVNDGMVLRKIAEYFFQRTKFNKLFHLKIDIRHGGGQRISEIFEDCQSDKRLMFSIVDSDKKHPTSDLGGTATCLIKSYGEVDLEHHYLILEISEIENIIPLPIYVAQSNQSQLPALSFLQFLKESNPESYLYYDFKKSFNYHQIFDCTDTPLSNYWKPKFESVESQYLNNKINEGANVQGTKNKKNVMLLNSLGVLFNHCKTTFIESDLSQYEDDILHSHWETIGLWICNRFISSKPINL